MQAVISMTQFEPLSDQEVVTALCTDDFHSFLRPYLVLLKIIRIALYLVLVATVIYLYRKGNRIGGNVIREPFKEDDMVGFRIYGPQATLK